MLEAAGRGTKIRASGLICPLALIDSDALLRVEPSLVEGVQLVLINDYRGSPLELDRKKITAGGSLVLVVMP